MFRTSKQSLGIFKQFALLSMHTQGNALALHSNVPVASQISTKLRRSYCNSTDNLREGLQKQHAEPFPFIETRRDFQNLVSEEFSIVKYGEYEFKQCANGFVYVFAHSHSNVKVDPSSRSSYVVVYGKNHPLNKGGGVEHRQDSNGAKLYSVLQTLRTIPENSFTKVCICLNETRPLTFISLSLKQLSENSYRGVKTGRLIKDYEIASELNELIRSRTDLTIQLRYIPLNIHYHEAMVANKWAESLAEELTILEKRKRSGYLIDLDLEQ